MDRIVCYMSKVFNLKLLLTENVLWYIIQNIAIEYFI